MNNRGRHPNTIAALRRRVPQACPNCGRKRMLTPGKEFKCKDAGNCEMRRKMGREQNGKPRYLRVKSQSIENRLIHEQLTEAYRERIRKRKEGEPIQSAFYGPPPRADISVHGRQPRGRGQSGRKPE